MNIEDIKKPENIVYKKSPILTDTPMHYCPGCSHGTVHKLVAEVIEEMGIQEETIGISPVGCSVFAYNYLDIDWQQAAHGRAPALATATKRLMPEKYVFEMICDWMGAGKAYMGKDFTYAKEYEWYINRQMFLHPQTKHLIDDIMKFILRFGDDGFNYNLWMDMAEEIYVEEKF